MIKPKQQVIHNPIEPIKRIVIKVGSALLIDGKKAAVRKKWLTTLAEDIAKLQQQGKQVIVVSSGSIALGRKVLGYGLRELTLSERQAAAAAGQPLLMKAWQEALASHHIKTAQLLITADDTEKRKSFLNMRNAVDTLIASQIVPIINENDVITAKGERVGDNDRLSARAAQMIHAGLLVLLSDIDGLYTKDPNRHEDAEHLPFVPEVNKKIRAMAGPARTATSSGGMRTKIEAANIATAGGCHMVICRGDILFPLSSLQNGAKFTLFLGQEQALSARKGWIVGTLEPKGSVVIDDGAVNALKRGNSLLPAGVIQVDGHFARGDAVWITDSHGAKIAKGLSAYNSDDADQIKGHQSDAIKKVLGFKARDVLINRDDMVML